MPPSSTIRRASSAAPSGVSHGRRSAPLLISAALGLSLLAGCSSGPDEASSAERDFASARPRVVAAPTQQTTSPPSNLSTPLPAGTVELSPGVFTDALRLHRATLRQGRRPVLEARLGNLVDAAPLLHLEVRASFYDRAGRYLGDATYVEEGHGEDDHGDRGEEEHDGEQYDVLPVRLSPAAPLPGMATAATVQVVQFVTE